MRVLAALFLLMALAVPFADAGAVPLPGDGACDLQGAIRADHGPGASDPLGPDRLAPFALTSPGPPEAPTGGSGGARREITVLPRKACAPALVRLAGSPLRARRDPCWRAALGPSLRVDPAHPSTAPPSFA